MEKLREWGDRLLAILQEAAQSFAELVPSLLFAAIVVLVGWLVARVLRFATVRAVHRVDWLFSAGVGQAGGAHHALTRGIAAIVFWTVFLVSIAAALGSLEIPLIDDWTARLISYLPILLGGLLIILLSLFAGSLVRQIVEPAAESMGAGNSRFIGRFCQVAVVLTGAVIGTSVLGIDVTFVIQLTTVVVGVALAGVGFALALGIREHLANIVGVRYAQKHFSPGEFVKIGGYEGRIVRFADGYLFLEAAEGDVSIPGGHISREPITRIPDEPGSGR
ncbi:MAG: hypothetical protein PVF63_07395 [Gammaproteobacteria bacterium]|jgi:uncharacterized membrane protein YjgN (DUF898 family)